MDFLHSSAESLDEVHWRHSGIDFPWWIQGGRTPAGPLTEDERAGFRKQRQYGAGLSLAFAKLMVQRTGVPVGLIPCAHGGASVGPSFDGYPGWDPGLNNLQSKSLYGAMLTKIRELGGKVKGILWWQGENDIGKERAAKYEERFRELINAIRSDLHQPELPFYYVQIGRCISNVAGDWPERWKKIQQIQSAVERSIPHTGMAASVDQEMQDGIHVSTSGLKVVGRRLANLACHDLDPEVGSCARLLRGPRPLRAHVQIQLTPLDAGRSPRRMIYVEFSEVNGRLRAPGQISGFSVRRPDGTDIPLIFHAFIDPAAPTRVVLEVGRGIPPDAQLWYGWGTNPHCNISDDANMGLPVFGPMVIERAGSGVGD